ncbi:hypothetical protein Y032_0065g3675 [Ancylostoma ceylanicum]|uniref:Uncharacterized protein n=1 Tax=Ancylostoma ceylanicum TaxID=53326 RepID=A0A016U1D7_9BILA|nr:hypothetical protein Y032_0065g3675 [Ancylostoma ceylanicum]
MEDQRNLLLEAQQRVRCQDEPSWPMHHCRAPGSSAVQCVRMIPSTTGRVGGGMRFLVPNGGLPPQTYPAVSHGSVPSSRLPSPGPYAEPPTLTPPTGIHVELVAGDAIHVHTNAITQARSMVFITHEITQHQYTAINNCTATGIWGQLKQW